MANADLFNPSAPLSGDNFTYFRAWVARQNNIGQSIFGDYDGSVAGYRNLSASDQVKLTNAMNAWVRANPATANEVQKHMANNAPISDIEELTLGEKIAGNEAVGAVIDTAYNVNKDLNPFAFVDSLAKLKWLIVGAAAVYFIGIPVAKAYLGKAGAK